MSTGVMADDGARWVDTPVLDYERHFTLALAEIGWTRKQAADRMGIDESHLSKALRGSKAHSLDLRKLMRMPWEFHHAFLLDLMHEAMKHDIRQCYADHKKRTA